MKTKNRGFGQGLEFLHPYTLTPLHPDSTDNMGV